MLAMADGCGLDVRCARGASSRGLGRGGSRWRRVVVDVGGWSVVGARLGCGCGLPPLPRCRGQRGSEAHASRVRPCCSTPFPLSSPAVSGCRSVGHAQGRARRWLAAGQRHTWQRPGNQRQRQAGGCGFRDQLITKRGPRGLDEGLVQVPVPVLERGAAGWTHALRGGGGGSVPCIPSRPRWR